MAGSDDKIMMRQRQREKKLHTKKMKALMLGRHIASMFGPTSTVPVLQNLIIPRFEHADESGDGILDMEDSSRIAL